jgi:cytoskeleton protein RodZ
LASRSSIQDDCPKDEKDASFWLTGNNDGFLFISSRQQFRLDTKRPPAFNTIPHMTNIGHQLQEARSKQGFTLKDVSDRIRIRPEYLARIEDNSFDIPLPEVYLRGFVRLYSKFLKLPADEMVDSFNKRSAQIRFSTQVAADREILGSYTAPIEERVADAETPESEDRSVFDRYRMQKDPKSPPWILLGSIALAAVLLFGTVFAIRIWILKPAPELSTVSDDSAQPTSTTAAAAETPRPTVGSVAVNQRLIELIARAPVYVYVTQTSDNSILYSGTLNTGERKPILRNGEIAVRTDLAENLTIERGGVAVDLQGTIGRAQFVIP